jgi:hypothetical protein
MKTRYILVAFLVGMGVFYSSCSLGMEPFSGKQGDAPTVLIQFSQVASGTDRSISRAIVQGDGFLYIRTLGGPTGDKGPFYGPYPVSAHTDFSTTDIPAGDYSSIMLLYSSVVLDGSYAILYNGISYSFTSLMALPDSDFRSFAGTSTQTSQDLGNFFNGRVSYGEKQSVTLKAGKTTNISMTLFPVTGVLTSISSPLAGYSFPSITPLTKVFYKVDGMTVLPMYILDSVTCTITSSTGILQKVDFYDMDGKLLNSTRTGPSLISGYTYTLDGPSSPSLVFGMGNIAMYLYLEYSGPLNATFAVNSHVP